MKKIFLFLAVAGTFFTSCSSDDDSNDGTPVTPGATAITLTSNVATVVLGGSFTFTVTDNLGTNVTTTSQYFVNDVAIASNVYTPTATGTYSVKAVNGTLTSPVVTVTVTAASVTNKIVYNGQNYDINNSALVFWGGAAPGGGETATHAFWSVLVFVGDNIANADPATSANYLDFEILTPLSAEGTVVLPAGNSAIFNDVYELHLNGAEITLNTVESGSVNFTSTLSNASTSATYALQSVFNTTSGISLGYNGTFGIYDGTGGRPAAKPAATFSSAKLISKKELAAKKASYIANLKK